MMKLLKAKFNDEVIETSEFYWNLRGTDPDMPNFWWKGSNIQAEWYNDDPGRAGFTNYETFGADDALSLLLAIWESYDNSFK